ncbi:MAG: hypothetical protein JXQ30_01365, partial [Spirochaetes bacterium]|nr:hypothetical protein [Spirochaetota bacterium]
GDDAVISKNAASGIVSGVYGDSIDEKETRGGDDAVISKNAASGGISISTSHKLSLYRTWFEEEILRSDITVLTGETDMDTIPSGSAPLGLASAGFERALEPYEKRLGPNLVLQAMNGVTRRLSEKISYEKRYEMLYGTTQGVKSHGAREDVESVMSLIDRMLEAAGCGSRENGNTYRR